MNRTCQKNNSEDDDSDFLPGDGVLGFSYKTRSNRSYRVHINTDIYGPSHYTKVFDALLDADEGDIVTFMISSGGGNLDGLSTLLEGIRMTDAYVIGVIVGEASSAASILALNCHEVIVTDSATMLVHNMRTGFGGKIADLEAFTNFSRKTSNKLIQETYEHFLSPEELQDVIHGKELWLDSEQIQERLLARVKALEVEEEEEVKKVSPKKANKKKKG